MLFFLVVPLLFSAIQGHVTPLTADPASCAECDRFLPAIVNLYTSQHPGKKKMMKKKRGKSILLTKKKKKKILQQ
jgi:hypothetical protein